MNKFTPKGKSVGFSDSHQGNRKWVMPVGAAFFTGTNSVSASAAPVSANASGKTVIAAPTAKAPVVNSNGTTRIMRPNEMIEEVRLMHVMHWQHSFCRILSSCNYLAMVCVVIGACAIIGLRASVLTHSFLNFLHRSPREWSSLPPTPPSCPTRVLPRVTGSFNKNWFVLCF